MSHNQSHPTTNDAGIPVSRDEHSRSTVPVTPEMESIGRLPESVEVAAYCVVAEALTNTTKHGQAWTVRVSATTDDNGLGYWLATTASGVRCSAADRV